MRGLRTRGSWTVVLLGMLVASLFAASMPARADPPTVNVISPDGGELVGAGTSQVGWNMSHGSDPFLLTDVDLSIDGGRTFPYRVLSGDFPAGGNWENWTVPTVDTTTARMRVCAWALDGNVSCDTSAGDFTIDTTPPYIVSTSPADGATNVALTASIVVVFSEPMDWGTVSWSLNPPKALTYAWNDPVYDILTLTPTTPWLSCTSYTITIMSGRDLAGNPLSQGPAPNAFTFTTVCSGPYIVSTDPADGETNVSQSTAVITFSEPMSQTSVTLNVTPSVNLTRSWNNASTVLTLTKQTPFEECTNFTFHVTGGQGVTGGSLGPGPVPNPWSFETACNAPYIVATDPADGAVNVPLDAPILVTFSEPMDPLSLNYTIWWTKPGTNVFNRSWSANFTVLTFTHLYPFESCEVYNVLIEAKDVDGNPLVDGPVPNPWSFTTECGQPPWIVYTTPANAAAQVLRDASVLVVFSEAMSNTSATMSFSPSVSNVVLTWTAPDFLIVTHDPFLPCRAYTVTVNATDLDGNGLIPGPVPNPWSFTVSCATVAVQLLSPVGGESWTGGTYHPVQFRVVNGLTATQTVQVSAVLRYGIGGSQSLAIGQQNVTVLGGGSVVGAFPWTTPVLDVTDAVVNLSSAASPAGDLAWDESGVFEIDSTPPTVLSYTPSGPHIPPDPLIVVDFSEPLAVTPGLDPIMLSPTVAHTYSWPAPDRLEAQVTGTIPCTMYTVTLGAAPVTLRDDSDPGNPLASFAWTFTTECLPSVDLTVPDGGQDWTGGSVHTIRWTTYDGDDPTLLLDLYYSTDGGTTYPNVIIAGMTVALDAGSYDWLVPRLDEAGVRVRAVVTDAAGDVASDVSRAAFTIDSTPPTILASFPSNGGSGHKTTRDLYFVFSERVDRASFEAAFSLTPNPGGVRLIWSVSNLGTDVLRVEHDPLKAHRDYAAAFAATAKDDSDPGNRLPAPLVVRFSTQPPPDVDPPVAKAVGKNQVQEGEAVTLDASQSTGNITQYVWRINDNQDRFVAILVGKSVPVAFREHGRYHVTLIVTDANGLTDEDTIEIAVTSNPNGILVITGVILLSAALTAATESGKAGFFSFVIAPLYVRRKRNEVLEHQTRGMILGYIMVHPGDTYTDIKRNLMLSNGTLTFHLNVLEKERLVRSQTRGPRKHFFPMGVRVPEDGGGMHELQVRIFRAVQNVPGLAVKDLAGALGITSQHALYHVRALAAQGFVRLERRGVTLRAYAEEGKSLPMHETSDES